MFHFSDLEKIQESKHSCSTSLAILFFLIPLFEDSLLAEKSILYASLHKTKSLFGWTCR